MPIYEFECSTCGVRSEHVLSLSDRDGPIECWCTSESTIIKRVIGTPALLRMGGFEGKLREGEQVKKRNDDHHKSRRGQEEYKHQVKAAHKRYLGIP